MSDYLPPEILFEIFVNLPTKTLCRFLSVSKSCYALIRSRPFVSAHLLQNPNRENNTFFLLKLLNKKNEEFSFFLDDETQNEETTGLLGVPSSTTSHPLVGAVGHSRIVGIENGLVCMINDFDHASNPYPFLWNPTLGRFVTLPSPESSPDCQGMCAFGFWFDSRTSDYKVMRIVYRSNKREHGPYQLPPSAEIYSVNSGEWRRVNVDGVKCYMPNNDRSHAYVNGRSHWIGYRYYPSCCLIMSFDENDEVVREILLPPELASMIAYDVKVTETMGCLVVIGDDQRRGFCRVWVMKEYGVFDSWTNLCDIPISYQNCYRFLGFWKNGDVLLIRDNHQLFRYAPGRKSLVDLATICIGYSGYAGKYEESLALLDLELPGSRCRTRLRPQVY